jgi:putative transposase
MLKDLEPLIQATCEQMGGELIEFGCEDDHLHLMLVIPPSKSESNFVGKLKGKSAYFLRKHHWDEVKEKLWSDHFWSPSYCVITCGGAPLDVVKLYVENQTRPSILAARLGAKAPEVARLSAQALLGLWKLNSAKRA